MTVLRVWAPNAEQVRAKIGELADGPTLELDAAPNGWWSISSDAIAADAHYRFLLDDSEELLTDPRSRRQPSGVHGPSQLYAGDFAWSDDAWSGRQLPGAVIYELHIGTFTEQGTFAGAITRLDHLRELGVTHVELLPVNDFNGVWNWGYDGVLWYAVHEAYGGPDGLKSFVDAAHARGLAVLLDVVYNHLGPSGNYLARFGPYFTSGRNTWGDLVNLDGPDSAEVRRYIIDNALMWLAEFHFDGLRLDAIHALQDSSPEHLLTQLSREVDSLSAHVGRPLTLIAESDLNDPIIINPRAAGGRGITAQWDDDVHHALHAALTGEQHGYYCDFGSLEVLAKVLTTAFLHDESYSTFRGRVHGKPVDRYLLLGYQFVVCLQNHDQVGNRAAGDRLPEIAGPSMLRVGALLLFTSAFTPMLWMGEEWAASTRWTFFTSHPEPELGEATGRGRIEEFASHGWDVSQVIDPQDPQAFYGSRLNWSELTDESHQPILAFYRELIALRARHAELSDPRLDRVHVGFDEAAGWLVMNRGSLRIVVNLAKAARTVPLAGGAELIFVTEPGFELGVDSISCPAGSGCVVRTATVL